MIADQFDPKSNSLSAFRLVLSALVVLGHSYELTGQNPDPFESMFGFTMGEFGVNGFFAISGFLIAGSWLKRPQVRPFITNRGLRIMPGLWACLLFTGLLLFPTLRWLNSESKQLPPVDWIMFPKYVFSNAFVKLNMTAVADVFNGLPSSGIVNNSLWSLLPEVLCYGVILVAGVTGILKNHAQIVWVSAAVVLLLHLAGPDNLIFTQVTWLAPKKWILWRYCTQTSFFLMGTIMRLHQKVIPASLPSLFVSSLVIICASVVGYYEIIAPFFLPHLLIVGAIYSPGRQVDKWGDFSYGLYIYHYPVIQSLLWCTPIPWIPGFVAALCLAITLPLAAVSWGVIEKPALRLKTVFGGKSIAPISQVDQAKRTTQL